ncbi:MAG TPA: carboxypeptidase-like regulatory domain-containing protein [Caulifigura sp.]|jgi:hypothetical protein|nr:carboxypeptidase-like regulatory domain-containing protein [Caulifigura sp.]
MRIGLSVVLMLLAVLGEARGDARIRGRVVDRGGNPVVGAKVYWLQPPPPHLVPESVDAETNGQGEFEVMLKGPRTASEVANDGVLIHAEGYLLRGAKVLEFSAPANGASTAVELSEQSGVTIRVVDAEGHVLGGELVEPLLFTNPAGSKLPAGLVQSLGQISNANGEVRFPALTFQNLKSVRVVSQTFGNQEVSFYSPPEATVTIQLRQTGSVHVTFDAANGQIGKCKLLAFTDAPFTAVTVPTIPPRLRGAYAEFFDAPREFEIPALAEGSLRFQLSGCSTNESVLPHWPTRCDFKAGERKEFRVPLEKTVTIRGRVLEANQAPAVGADVYVYTRNAGGSILATSDKEGRYRVNVLQGPTSVTAMRNSKFGPAATGSTTTQETVVGEAGHEFPDLMMNSRSTSP